MRGRGALACAALAAILSGGAFGAADLGTEPQRQAGKQLYDKYCAQCHGLAGDGKGHATGRVKPAPRDFTSGKYKFRTTPSGMLPTDDDLRRVIKNGLPYTSMPGWPALSDAEIQNVVYHLKTFSPDFADPAKQAKPIDIPEPPALTDESVQRGRAVYESQGCAACHGNAGRGNGPSAPTLKDDWGQHIRAADLTQRWTFRGGPTRRDVFRTFSTGLNGTPMPSYFDSLEVRDRWDLVDYIESLGEGDSPGYSSLLLVEPLQDEIDLAQGPELFAAAPKSRFPLLGQIVEPGRNFQPSTASVEVQAVYNRREIAFLVRWNDLRADTVGVAGPALAVPPEEEDLTQAAGAGEAAVDADDDFWGGAAVEAADAAGGTDDFWGEEAGETEPTTADSEFADAVALQFPVTPPAGIRKPYFIYGDVQNPVDLWFVDLARPTLVRQFTARGGSRIEPSTADDFEVAAGYAEGQWYAIYKRALRSTGNITFQEGQFVPIAFSVWDGFNRERGSRRALSSWFYLYPKPVERVSAVGPMVRAAAIALVFELVVILWIRRRFRAAEPQPATPGGGLPHRGLTH